MKYFLILLILLLAMAGWWLSVPDGPVNDTAVTGLPWQVERFADGYTQVFGIIPGKTSLDEATGLLGDDMELAIIAVPDTDWSLEAYYGHYSAGPITGRLILVMDIPAHQLAAMHARAVRDGATYRYRLNAQDLASARAAPVDVITFAPSFDLDTDIASARFGVPDTVVEAGAGELHWLYTERRLDLVLDSDGREILQYMSPRAFTAWREQLQSD